MRIAEMNQEQRREYNRKRQKESRDRRKQTQENSREAALEKIRGDEINRTALELRKKEGHCFFGEISPGVDATTVESALQVCREFARALGEPDVQLGQTLAEFEWRIGRVWADRGGPFLHRRSQTLSLGWGAHWLCRDYWKPFEQHFTQTRGGNKPIDAVLLPPQLPIPVAKPEATREPQPEKLVDPSGTPSPEEQAEFRAQQLLGNSVRELDDAARRRAGLQ